MDEEKKENSQQDNYLDEDLKDKYKIFYEISKDGYKEIHDNYYKLLDKASKYLQFLSIIIGVILFGAKWYIDRYNDIVNNKFLMTIIVIVLGLVCVIELTLILRVMAVKEFSKIILKREDEEYFIKNNKTQIYSGLALRYSETNAENFIHLESKGGKLKKAQRGLITLLILIFISIIFLYININYG